MGDLTYIIIFLVVINILGRIFRAIQKSSGQQTPGTKPTAPQPKAKPKGTFAVLTERLEKLSEMEKQIPREEGSAPPPIIETKPEEFEPEMAAAETPRDFSRETAATREANFESKPHKELQEESFPWQDTQYGYKPPVQPVTRAPGPEQDTRRSYHGDVIRMLRDHENVRNAVLLANILGPCRAREGKYRFRGPR